MSMILTFSLISTVAMEGKLVHSRKKLQDPCLDIRRRRRCFPSRENSIVLNINCSRSVPVKDKELYLKGIDSGVSQGLFMNPIHSRRKSRFVGDVSQETVGKEGKKILYGRLKFS